MNDAMEMLVNQSESCPTIKECYIDSLIDNLNRRKKRAERELQQVNAALDALRKNPEVAEILELISKVGR